MSFSIAVKPFFPDQLWYSYVNRETAFQSGLAYVTEEGLANMHVDSWTNLTVDEVNSGTKLRQRYAPIYFLHFSGTFLYWFRDF
jgi:hypothetical protein